MAEEKDVFQKLSEKIMIPDSKLIPELFQMLVTKEEGEILLSLPGTAAHVAAQFGADENDMAKKLQEFFIMGLVFKSKKPEGTKYRLCRDVAQFHDATILWPKATREYLDKWQYFMEDEWPEYSKLTESLIPKPFTRIIPVEKAISSEAQVLPYETCKELIDKANIVAVTRCTCRLSAQKCDRPVDVCLQIDRAAQYTIERGTGHEITKEEAMEIIRRSEEAGLVHLTMNKSENMHFICNCCGCCCMSLPLLIKYGRKLTDPSRFQAVVNEEECSVCGSCEENCPFKAVVMEEKDGKETAIVNAQLCMGCGICQVVCPSDSIMLKEVRDRDFIPA